MAGKMDGRKERLELEEAAKASEKKFSQDVEEKPSQKLPKRYKLYDKIAKYVTLRIIDAIIVVTVILIVAAIAVSLITGR